MRTHPLVLIASLTCLAAISGAASAQAPAAPPANPLGKPDGYIPPKDLPDSLALLPPPPAAGSPGMARDEAARTAAIPLRGSARWAIAASDAELGFPHDANVFSCAIGVRIDPKTTPRLYRLMTRSFWDLALSTYKAKNHYQRTRPFVVHDEGTCNPSDEPMLRKDGSYPSGHTTLGWGWALILTEAAPDRQDAILARGRDFGQSRVICNAHWQSDVDAGRWMASAAVARLHADKAFRSDLAAATREVARARARGLAPAGDCAAEAAALQ